MCKKTAASTNANATSMPAEVAPALPKAQPSMPANANTIARPTKGGAIPALHPSFPATDNTSRKVSTVDTYENGSSTYHRQVYSRPAQKSTSQPAPTQSRFTTSNIANVAMKGVVGTWNVYGGYIIRLCGFLFLQMTETPPK